MAQRPESIGREALADDRTSGSRLLAFGRKPP